MMAEFRGIIFLLAASLALAVGAASAEEPHEDEHHAHEAHVHGAWDLFAALDDKQLSVTVRGPMIDVLGFERLPENEQERAAIRELNIQLNAPQSIFILSEDARCTLIEPAEIILPEGFSAESAAGQESAQEADSHHEHDTHEGDNHHDGEDTHANDFEVNYVFTCRSPFRLRAITASGFETFPNVEYVEAVFLGSNAQKALRLTRGSKTLRLD